MSRPSKVMVPEVGGKNPLIRLKKVVLPAPFGPMIAHSSPFATLQRDVAHRHEIAEPLGDVVDFENVHALLRCRKPSSPRGKNSTTRTNSRPTNDIQLTVTLDR